MLPGDFEKFITDNDYYTESEKIADSYIKLLSLHLEKFLDQANKKLNDNYEIIISLDAFDTYILRNSKCEIRRFQEISERMIVILSNFFQKNISTYEIFLARQIAHKMSYRMYPSPNYVREPNLLFIYRNMLKILDFYKAKNFVTGQIITEMKNIEIEYEIENTYPNVLLDKTIRKLQEKFCYKVIILSDMYLTSDIIKKILDANYKNLPPLYEDIISSADINLSKSSGLSFEYIKRKYQEISNKDKLLFVHVGDNYHSDVKSSKKRGLYSLYHPISRDEKNRRKQDEKLFAQECLVQGINFDLKFML